MKLVYKDENMTIVHSVKNILELNDIDCVLKNEHSHTMGAEFGLSDTLLELWLSNDDDYEKASSLIDSQVLNPPTKSSWVCGKCGEENEGSFEICWKCQNSSAR